MQMEIPITTSENTVLMLYPFEGPLVLSVCLRLLLHLSVWTVVSCGASPQCPNSPFKGKLRTGTALLPSSLVTQVPHVLPKPQFIPALAVSTNVSQKRVLFQC